MQKITPITAPFPHGESRTGSGQKRSALEAQASSPKAKRTKSTTPTSSSKVPPISRPLPVVLKPFPVKDGDFAKPGSSLPRFQRPEEVGFMSLNQARQPAWDKSLLSVFVPVNPKAVRLDLSVGFDKYKEKESRPGEGISPILTWLNKRHGAVNRDPQRRSSEEQKRGGVSPAGPVKTTTGSSPEKATGLTAAAGGSKSEAKRSNHLHTDFVSWRGMLTKIICSYYDQSPWKMAATRYKGTIYFREFPNEAEEARKSSQTDREKRMCYWGVKFEDYMTASTLTPNTRTASSLPGWKGEPANDKEEFCSFVRTKISQHSVIMAGEVDCCEHEASTSSLQNYIELKTTRVIYTDKNKYSFKRFKLLKWWVQSFLIGVPKIVCGFRDDSGIVQKLETFRTLDIPKQLQGERNMWDPAVCLNLLDQFLTWVKQVVRKDNPRVAVLFEWKEPFTHITACEYPEGSGEYTVLPEWYYTTEPDQAEHQHPMLPPSGEASTSSGKQGTVKEKLN